MNTLTVTELAMVSGGEIFEDHLNPWERGVNRPVK